MLLLITLSLTLTRISGNPNVCPKVKGMEYFDFNTFFTESRWYEVERYDSDFEKGADCPVFEYFMEEGKVICLLQEVVDKKIVTKYRWIITQSPDDKSKVYCTPENKVDEDLVVYILDTDYKNYVIFYDCFVDKKTNTTTENAWVGSKSPSMKPEIIPKVEEFLKAHPYVEETRMFKDHFTPDSCKGN